MTQECSESERILKKIRTLDPIKDHVERVTLCRLALSGKECDQESELSKSMSVVFARILMEIEDDNCSQEIEEAIEILKCCLETDHFDITPRTWGNIHDCLGDALVRRVRGISKDNLELALHHYESSRDFYSSDGNLDLWAEVNGRIGLLYLQLLNSDVAIQFFLHSLDVYSEDETPMKWATVQRDIARAYMLSDMENASEYAIQHYQLSLRIITKDNDPYLWGDIHKLIGRAFLRLKSDRESNIELAIKHIQTALSIFGKEKHPVEWAQSQRMLGRCYYRRAKGESSKNLETALSYYNLAQSVFTKTDHPLQWANLQWLISSACTSRSKIEERRKFLSLAIEHLKCAIGVYEIQGVSKELAVTRKQLSQNEQLLRLEDEAK